jgi:uncharacterized protein
VRVRRRKGRITVPPLSDDERARLLDAASHYVAAVERCHGRTQGELLAACDEHPSVATDFKLLRGLRKLLFDRCTFAPASGIEPRSARKVVFGLAAQQRRASAATFDATAILTDAARLLAGDAALPQLTATDVEAALFADLHENQRLAAFEALDAAALVRTYELAQHQAVLLRALRVVVKLRADTAGLRSFFRRLKFRRLLYTAQREDDGAYRIEIDGPFSLFRAVTQYGLQLALMLPALDESGAWELDADVRWGSDEEPSRFHLVGRAPTALAAAEARLPDDVALLAQRFEKLATGWKVSAACDLLDLPGVGLSIPDLVFTHEGSGRRVYLEVMGYWSRAAVWRRVELVQAGLEVPIIFAVSARLRVSEAVLDDALPGQLYVYKGVMSAAAIAERLAAHQP